VLALFATNPFPDGPPRHVRAMIWDYRFTRDDLATDAWWEREQLEIVYGDVRLLLTGDVEAGGEARLKTGKVHIAKVPHHGSRSSSSPEFVERIEPRLALVSAGFRNRFGHPHPTVVSRYRRHGRVLSTAEEGALSISTDGRRIWVSTYEGVHEERLR
jgi:beta-lactamase superfamily II metal-dependent hydrolase